MTRHQRKLLKKQEQGKTFSKGGVGLRKHKGHVAWLLFLVALTGAAVYGWKYLKATTPEATYTAAPVHWHAKIDIEVCGEKRDLPGPKDGSKGGPDELHHHHGDNTWHIEGRILRKEDIALGTFFDAMNIPFDRDRIMEKKNGDLCSPANKVAAIPGKPGSVKMFVNGKPNDQFRDFVGQYTQNGDDNVIKISFE